MIILMYIGIWYLIGISSIAAAMLFDVILRVQSNITLEDVAVVMIGGILGPFATLVAAAAMILTIVGIITKGRPYSQVVLYTRKPKKTDT